MCTAKTQTFYKRELKLIKHVRGFKRSHPKRNGFYNVDRYCRLTTEKIRGANCTSAHWLLGYSLSAIKVTSFS